MSGYSAILFMNRLIHECDSLGFMMAHSKHGNSVSNGDVVALRPKDHDALPIYARDAELFVGTLEQLEVWLRGVKWARDYDRMLRLSNDDRRERKEQDERNRKLVRLLKDEV